MAPPGVAVETKNRLFVSYSRRDAGFVRKLCAGLLEQGIDSWVDWEDIPPSAEWMDEIRRGIDSADAFAFVISADSVASKVCGEELGHAVAAGKRLIPLRLTDVDQGLVSESLRRLNWIDARDPAAFADVVRRFVEALTTDLVLLRTHARLLVRAREWLASGRDPSFLLRGTDLEEALRWLGAVGEAGPLPTPEHNEYVIASQHAQREEMERWQGLYRRALARQLAAQSELLRGQRPDDLELAVLLAAESLHIESSREATMALGRGLELLPRRGRIDLQLHDEPINEILHSGDGRWLFAAGDDGAVRVIDVRRGVEQARLAAGERAMELAISDDASYVACGDYRTPHVWVWRWPQGELLRTLELAAVVTTLTLSADGAWLAVGCEDGVVAVYRPGESEPTVQLRHGGPVNAMAFRAAQGQLVTGADDGGTRLWSVSDGRLVWTHDHGAPVQSVACSSDGRRVASAGLDQCVTLLDPELGLVLGTVVHDEPVHGVHFSPDSRRLAAHGFYDADVLVVDAGQGRLLTRFAPASGGHGIAFDSTSLRVATTGLTAVVQVWDVDARSETARHVDRSGVPAIAFAPDSGELRIADAIGHLGSVDLGSGRTLRHGERMQCATLSPDGSLVVVARGDGCVHVFLGPGHDDAATVQVGHDVSDMDIDDDGRHLVVQRPMTGDLELWDPRAGRLLWRSEVADRDEQFADLRPARLGPGGHLLALEGSQSHDLELRDAANGSLRMTAAHDDVASHGGFSPDGRLWVTTSGNTLKVWDTAAYRLRFELEHGDYVSGTQFSPDGDWLVTTAYDGLVRIIDATGGRVVAELRHEGMVSAVAVAPAGDWLAAAGDESVTIWRFDERRLVHRVPTDVGVEHLAFTHDGSHLVGGSRGQRARFWAVADGVEVLSIAHDGAVFGVRFDADDRFCLVQHAKGPNRFFTAWLWQPDHLLDLARQSVTRALTPEEWRTYLGDEPYAPMLSPAAPSPVR